MCTPVRERDSAPSEVVISISESCSQENQSSRSGIPVAVPHCCDDKRAELEAKLSIYRAIFVPTLTYGHKLWVMTERIRSQEGRRGSKGVFSDGGWPLP